MIKEHISFQFQFETIAVETGCAKTLFFCTTETITVAEKLHEGNKCESIQQLLFVTIDTKLTSTSVLSTTQTGLYEIVDFFFPDYFRR